MKFDKYIELLLKYNKTHKLTGAKTKDEVMFHINDSLYPFERFKDSKKVLDIGTGAGFPGIILAMVYPNIEFFLVEPLQKRVAFLYLIKSSYALKNVTILSDRVENLEGFRVDVITSKAVSSAKELIKISKNFIDKDTTLLLYKGENVDKETKDLKNYEIIKNGTLNYLIIKDLT